MYIYGLFDPETNELRYVGFTSKNINERLRGHLKDRGKNHKANWIKNLKNRNLVPQIEILFNTTKESWEFDEQWSIQYYRFVGCDLTNMSDGGSKIFIVKKGTGKGKILSESHRKNIGKAQLGRKRSVETKRKMSQWQIGKKHSDDTKKKMSNKLMGNQRWLGKTHSEESKQKMRKPKNMNEKI